jgi:hypothetical protein
VPYRLKTKFRKIVSAHAAVIDHAAMEFLDPVRGRTLAKAWDHRMQQTGKAGQKQDTGEGKGHALMLEVGFAHRLGMDQKEPREHGRTLI